ncbi:MAG: hypothetical protein ACRQFF_12340 [Sphaerochaeta sp.]
MACYEDLKALLKDPIYRDIISSERVAKKLSTPNSRAGCIDE